MTDEAVALDTAPAARPYAPSWLDRLLDAIERLPVPAPAAYVGLWLLAVVAMNAEPWLLGGPSPWNPVQKTYWGSVVAAQLAGAAYLRRTAATSFDAFRPALSLPEGHLARLRYELSVIPAGLALIAAAFGVALVAVFFMVDPTAFSGVALSGVLLVAAVILVCWVTTVMVVILVQLVRQMVLVRRILGESAAVDVFRPGPLHAFSRLTARGGGLMVLLVASTLLVVQLPKDPAQLLAYALPFIVVPPLIAVASFVMPVYDMHERLVAEKERLQGETEDRLRGLYAEINRNVDARELSNVEALNRAASAVAGQRDVLAKLPTWPWSAGTLRGFVTAIFLPLGLFVLQRVLSQLL